MWVGHGARPLVVVPVTGFVWVGPGWPVDLLLVVLVVALHPLMAGLG